jgi:hypothetical protein
MLPDTDLVSRKACFSLPAIASKTPPLDGKPPQFSAPALFGKAPCCAHLELYTSRHSIGIVIKSLVYSRSHTEKQLYLRLEKIGGAGEFYIYTSTNKSVKLGKPLTCSMSPMSADAAAVEAELPLSELVAWTSGEQYILTASSSALFSILQLMTWH